MKHNKMSKRERIDASREVRLWLTTVLVPIGTIMALKPELAEKAKDKLIGAKDFAVDKFDDLKNRLSKK